MDLTPKQQTSEAIRQAETILITTGQHPNVDQVVSVLALAAILRKFGKKVSAIISDPLPPAVQFLDMSGIDKNLSGLRDFILKVDVTKAEVDKLRYEVIDGKLEVFITPFKGGFAPSDVTFAYGDYHYDLAIVLGVPSRSRIDRVYAENQGLFNSIPLVNLDFHRTNESYGAVNLIEPMASSLCEILVATSESLQSGLIDADIATVMLTGLMASTDRFTASHTTSKSLTVAAQLMAAGAKQQQVVKGLFRDGRDSRDSRPERSNRPAAEPRQNQGQSNQSRPAQQSERRPEPQPQPSRQPELATASASAVAEPAAVRNPEAEHTVAPGFAVPANAEPVIAPDHIEPSVPVVEPASAPVPATPASAPVVPAEPAVVPDLASPMADFAAAAELLRDHGQAEPTTHDQA